MQRQNERLQGAQETRLAERRQMEGKLNIFCFLRPLDNGMGTANISSLRAENKMFQGTDSRTQSHLGIFSANA